MANTTATETKQIAPDLEKKADAVATLDPSDWESFRAQSHRMLDDMLDYIRDIRQHPVWQPMPARLRVRSSAAESDGASSVASSSAPFGASSIARPGAAPLPRLPSDLAAVHDEFMRDVVPFTACNIHPGFMGWLQGGGTPVGMLAEMIAAGLNANLGGRDHAPIEIERQVVQWVREIFGFPESSTGIFVTGTSMANLIAVVIARDVALGFDVRRCGVAGAGASKHLAAYASSAVHGSIAKAMDISGIGSDALRLIQTDNRHRIDVGALEMAIQRDRAAGAAPFLIVASAGTVDTGAVDDLASIAELCHRERIWLHVDGACGALAMFAPDLAPKLRGIERADSLAFDFHKWAQVPYDAGFILVRDGTLHHNAFASSAAYLERTERGLAADSPWPCDFGPELSRGFRALKAWATLKVYGLDAIGAAISRTCALARCLESRIVQSGELELLAPVELNIVCFRYRFGAPSGSVSPSPKAKEPNASSESKKIGDVCDRLNREIVIALQEAGAVAPSSTIVGGRLAIRAAIVNHRTGRAEIDLLVESTLSLGRALQSRNFPSPVPQPTARESAAPPAVESFQESSAAPPAQQLSQPFSAQPDFQPAVQSIPTPATPTTAASQLPPDRASLLFKRANILRLMGRNLEAQDSYAELLNLDPSHAGALNNLGNLFFAAGNKAEARRLYSEALARHPGNPLSSVNLGILLLQTQEFDSARVHFEHALAIDPDNRQAHIGMSFVLASLGDPGRALRHRRAAFEGNCVIPAVYRGKQPPIAILELVASPEGNSRIGDFLSDRFFHKFLVVAEFYDPATVLPPHQFIVNAISDADVAAPALAGAQRLLAHTTAPIINRPDAVLATGRCEIARRLSGIPGIITPATITLSRESLLAPDALATLRRHGFDFPLLVRSLGFHGGEHFERVQKFDDLPAAVAQLPERDLAVIQFLDARSPDGKTRKYRVMMVDGELYPLHAATSSNWKIHFFSADMADSPAHRAYDAAFLENVAGVLGSRALDALRQIQRELGLDYGGIDFGLNENGDVLLFEANATMAVIPPSPDTIWDYRRPAVERIYLAVLTMLTQRLRVAPPQPASA
jgi:aromatic-L-amino-acid/L-tryptophan decarboxylase